jgi:large conductance mechanosensitive channel
MSDVPPRKQSFAQEFMAFLKNFGIIGLAIAFIIGAAASKLVTALVNDLINPIVGLALPSGDLKSLQKEVINNASGAISVFKYGDFIANVIDFTIIAVIVFILYKILSRFKMVDDKTKVSK